MKVEEAIDKAWWAREGVYKRARFDMLDETDAEYASIIEAGNKAMLTSLRTNGFVVVPVEATEKMHHAARDWSIKKYGQGVGRDGSEGCWNAMLTAAQENDDGR